MSASAWLFLGTAVTAAFALIGSVVTVLSARASTRAQARAELAKTSVEGSKVDIDKSKADVENLRNIIADLNEHIERLQSWHEDAEQRCDLCLEENKSLRLQVASLTLRVRGLEADRGA